MGSIGRQHDLAHMMAVASKARGHPLKADFWTSSRGWAVGKGWAFDPGRRLALVSTPVFEWGRCFSALVGLMLALFMASPVWGQSLSQLNLAGEMVERSERSGGMCALVGVSDAGLAVALAQHGSFVVQCLADTPRLCSALRQDVASTGLPGQVSVRVMRTDSLPYADNLLNMVIVSDAGFLFADAGFLAEISRVVAPLGTIFIRLSGRPDGAADGLSVESVEAAGLQPGKPLTAAPGWRVMRKPWPDAIDEWTHFLHGADGNPVAEDRVVGPPKHYQWLSAPLWLRSHETDSSVSTLVSARGRLFAIIDQAPISLAGEHPLPDKWFLVAQDAFNGAPLWQVPIRRWGWREWKHSWFSARPGDFPLDIRERLVARGDDVFVTLGYRAPVSRLDARTGDILETYPQTEGAGEVLVVGSTLLVPVIENDRGHLVAVNLTNGATRWRSERGYRGSKTDYLRWSARHGRVQEPPVDAALNVATDGTFVALIDDTRIICLDFDTGRERWQAEFPTADADRNAGGIRAGDRLWNGTMIVKDGVIVHASPGRVAGYDARSGGLLWQQDKSYIGHLWYEWKDVFVIEGLVWTWSPELGTGEFEIGGNRVQRTRWPETANGYDLRTGELKKSVPLGPIYKTHHHHRCYRNKATVNYLITSRRGTEYVDLHGGSHTVHNWVRGTCHVGMMPANGLQYAPPHPCTCYIDEKLNGMTALAPASSGEALSAAAVDRFQLLEGPAYGQVSPLPDDAGAITGGWPAFRCDAGRSGSVSTRVPDDAEVRWRRRVGVSVTPPIAVRGRVYVALKEEQGVVCLDAADGRERWRVLTGGRVDSPPTYYRGLVLFGSCDGSVYCCRAVDGAVVWEFLPVFADRQIGAFGQFESAWPVHGSVLVQNGRVYVAAGRSSQLDGGIRLYALDPSTGTVLARTRLAGPDYTAADIEENFRLPMGALPDILAGDGERVFMRNRAFDGDLNPVSGAPDLQLRSGFLDDNYFKRVPWRMGGEYGRMLVRDQRSVYYVRMFDSLRGLDPKVYFTPGRQGYLLFAKDLHGEKKTWMDRIPVRIRAMVLAGDRLFVSGPPDTIDPADPLGAFEGRKGGVLSVFETVSGKALRDVRLPAPPVFNGAAAADGCLYLSDTAGWVTCFAAP